MPSCLQTISSKLPGCGIFFKPEKARLIAKNKPLPVQPAGAAGRSANGRGARWFAEDLPMIEVYGANLSKTYLVALFIRAY